MIDAAAYFERIGYRGPREPTLETLRGLHRAHLFAVPFENLDVVLTRRPLVIEPAALFEKIVVRRRGGLCYELNGLFSELLRALGFRVHYLSAGVSQPGGAWGPPFGHVALRVDLDEPWLADVGFGRDSYREPLRLADEGPQPRGPAAYRVRRDGEVRIVEMQTGGGGWTSLYRFGLEARPLAEFEPMCIVHQTSPEAPFTRVPIAGLATPEGRVTLVDRRLKIVSAAGEQERELADDAARSLALREYFGIAP